jgi:hypothetical protein
LKTGKQVAAGKGYQSIKVNGKRISTHQAAHLIMTGVRYRGPIDHANRVTNDNRWGNLRPADFNTNGYNAKIRIDNTTGAKGVGFHKKTGKYQARVRVNGKRKHLGFFDTIAEAAQARADYAKLHHGEFYCAG